MKRYLTAALAGAGVFIWAAQTLYGGAVVDLPAFHAIALDRSDDVSSAQISLPFTLNFFGQQFNSLYVNTNGNVTFLLPLPDSNPRPLAQTGMPIIAPFWANWDAGLPQDPSEPAPNQVTYGIGTIGGRQTFGADWLRIGYFDRHDDKLNSAQLLLIDRSDTGAGNFDIELNYDQIQWEAGDDSNGIQGFGGNSARAGFSSGAAAGTFELPGSTVNGAFLDGGPDALATNSLNTDVPGRYAFEARDGNVLTSTNPPATGVPLPPTLCAALTTLAATALALRLRRRA